MSFGDVVTVVANNHIVDMMTIGVVVSTGHVSSQTRYLVDESELFKEFEVSIDGRDIDFRIRMLFYEFVGVEWSMECGELFENPKTSLGYFLSVRFEGGDGVIEEHDKNGEL